jgi:hypothetical protein
MLIAKELIGREVGLAFKAAPFSMEAGPTGMGTRMNTIKGRLETITEVPEVPGDQLIRLRVDGGVIRSLASEICFVVEYSPVASAGGLVRP